VINLNEEIMLVKSTYQWQGKMYNFEYILWKIEKI
jgi:hypothetical protein